ncbi:MAG: DinB family protein [Anaerolineales bacterium]|nr:DinB family protein [Anaerolineales bacterium]
MTQMVEATDRLAERLISEGQKTCAFFEALSSDQLEQALYTAGAGWTIRQALAHFVAAEAGFRQIMEDILAGGTGAPEQFDLETYNDKHVAMLADTPAAELIVQFRFQRQMNINLVQKMTSADLLKTGRHPYLGMTSMQEIIQLLYRHNQIHQRDIRRMLAGSQDQQAQPGDMHGVS